MNFLTSLLACCKKKQLIIVIVPMFNAESNIEKPVQSVLNQKYKNIELLLIDDSSYDKTQFYAALAVDFLFLKEMVFSVNKLHYKYIFCIVLPIIYVAFSF
jgi:hypothetical protein